MKAEVSEDLVTNSITAALAAAGWDLHSVAAPGMGSGTQLRPNAVPGQPRPKNKGGIVIDVIATRAGEWLLLENKDRFSTPDLEKLRDVRDSGRFSEDLERLTGSSSPSLRFGLGMPDTPTTRSSVAAVLGELDCFALVLPDRTCSWRGAWCPTP